MRSNQNTEAVHVRLRGGSVKDRMTIMTKVLDEIANAITCSIGDGCAELYVSVWGQASLPASRGSSAQQHSKLKLNTCTSTTGHAIADARTSSQFDPKALELATQCSPSEWMGLLVMSTQSVCAAPPELSELELEDL
ncbi:hypothetical protein G7054_g13438 [Neopestalotiopsis clavispora]|nr:hypothetical protein G7054_g13438 [Neopestalotiopsis clavispora]